MQGVVPCAVADLMTATEAVGHDQRVGRCLRTAGSNASSAIAIETS